MLNVNLILFIVDGPSEVKALQEKFESLYRCKPDCRAVKCNGSCVSVDGYVNKAIPTTLHALHEKYRYIIYIIDKENRKINVDNLRDQIKAKLIEEIVKNGRHYKNQNLNNKVKICIPDRMFENWIIADVIGIKTTTLIRKDARQEKYEGKHGANILNSMMNTGYKKTTHAPILFKRVHLSRAAKNSSSFNCFLKSLNSCT